MSYISRGSDIGDGGEITLLEELYLSQIAALGTATYFLRINAAGDGLEYVAAPTGVTVETPAEAVNSINTEYTATSEPKWIVVDGGQYFANNGYTYSDPTVTVDFAPSGYIKLIL